MTHKHIVSAFDRDLEGLQALTMKMGGLVEESIRNATTSLVSRDEALAQKVRDADARVDALEDRVNEDAARIIAMRQPIASDMRTVLSVIKISANLERIGDYSKNMAKRTGLLMDLPVVDGASHSIRRMAREVEQMLHDVLDAYIQRDADLARDVRARDESVDQMYNALFREFLTFMMEDPRNITGCMHLHFIAKNIERMGDHVTSIADQVIYIVEGALPADDRPKADRTSSAQFEG
ncbi:phosphate signaling complex protein PhoU [Palleronia sediminis]|uniref:Phosphate-specific transport system accessory protein PhoU n=1 Tax=Palleronia sediminis TaxID=2547833 RepID=A0A4R6AK13_9RHOB|nr:phosphate signaling complex protein PhoU [Palleronia sediminis]TDL83622.1 phosphate signaling complex protein PhoU [Palleronia sediminis]